MITNGLFSSEKYAAIGKKVLMTVTGFSAAAILFASVSMTGLAAAKGTVMATAAKVRATASTSSESLVSLPQGTVLDIQEEVTGNDGKIWYKVTTDGGKTGYIRSDLMTKTEVEDSNPTPSEGAGQGSTLAPGVTAVNPVTAKVSGAQVRVRSSASTSGDIVTTVEKDVALTVLGTATDGTGKIWYQITYTGSNGTVDGFVRNDFVTLEGELTAPVETPVVEDPPVDMPEEETEPVVETPVSTKDYETEEKDGVWYLNLPKENMQYKISDLFDAAQKNAELYAKSQKSMKTMKYVMGILILIAAAAVIAMTMVLLKFKDLKDALEFGQTERETMERRRQERAQKNKASREAAEKQAAEQERPKAPQQRPQGQTAQRPQGQTAQRPQGQAPTGKPVQKRPATTDVSGNPVNQSKPAANVQARPAGQRPQEQAAKAPQEKERVLHNEQLRTPEAMQTPKKPAQRPQGQAPQTTKPAAEQPKPQPKPQQSKPKNFLEDDDEFEFEFLNWDGDNK